MFDQVSFVPVDIPSLPDPVACCAVVSLHKNKCPEHIGQMMKSPFKVDFKGALFENYEKMYQTCTWIYPLLSSLIPKEVVLLPICPAYAVKSTLIKSLWELQVRFCANGDRMQQGVHFDEFFSPVASIKNIRILLNLGASQGKSVYILDSKNAFQNNIQFDPNNRAYNRLPSFFAEYVFLHWSDHPEVDAITSDTHLYTLQNFCSMQGEKDAGRRWYQLLANAPRNVGMHRSVVDYTVFTWEDSASEMFLAVATDKCLCVCDDRSFFGLRNALKSSSS
jgi:hypothetical protein